MIETSPLRARLTMIVVLAVLTACGGSDEPPVNQAPAAQITSPADGSTFRAGDTLAFAATVSDPEDGPLPPARIVWWVDLHHDSHSHPFHPETSGASGTVAVPTRGETSDNIFLRFHLRATDSKGATHDATRDVLPRKAQITLATEPAGAGLALTLDGQPAPATFTGVVGMERTLGTATEQIINNRRYQFSGWSDGGAAIHGISTPDVVDATYTAVFTDLGPLVNSPPVVALTAPLDRSSGTIGVAISISAEATDTDDRIAGVEFFENGFKIGSTVTSAPYSVSWTPATEGTRTLKARAIDNFGLTTSAEVTVDVRALVRIVAPANFANDLIGPLTITADAADNTGVAQIEIQVDGQPVSGGMGTGTSHSVSIDTNNYASGQHILRARVTDAMGIPSEWVKTPVSFGGERTHPAGFVREDTGWWSGSALAQTPDGRFLVALLGGEVLVMKNGAQLPDPMLTLTNVDRNGERGLIGVAVDPDFATNGWIYVHYTTTENGPIPSEPGAHNRITRYTVTGDTAGSPTVLVDLPPLSSSIHNGGAMHFGADGKLYVGVGDNAIGSQAPDLASVFGKILRFNSDGSIPADNPYYSSQAGLARAIWARGLRNPFTFAVQPGTGRLHINDVGQNSWEEINLGAPAANYGWPSTEGPTGAAGIAAPLFTYAHGTWVPPGSGPGGFFGGCAIVGGDFYPGAGTFPPAYRGSYYFTDFCSGFVGRIDLANGNDAYAFGKVPAGSIGMIVGLDGSLYVGTPTGIMRFRAQ
jgi:glucose/arabinose dehydrogenase